MTPERFRRLRSVLSRRQLDLTVLMDGVHKPHNFSAILRNCDAVGVFRAHAVPTGSGLPLHTGTAAGSERWVEVEEHADVNRALDTLEAEGMRIVVAHPTSDARDFRTLDYTRPTCIVVGAELHGVSDAVLARSHERVVIPMVGMVRSFNVSVATSLLLFEAFRQREQAGSYDEPSLGRERFDRILFEWAYPRAAARLRDGGRPYPPLDEDGDIVGETR